MRDRRLKDGNISHVTARAEMTSTLVSSIHSERSMRLWARRGSIREETYWWSITTRERACIQLTGKSVEIIAIFKACSTAKMHAVRTFKLHGDAELFRERAHLSIQFLLLILSRSVIIALLRELRFMNEEVHVWCRLADS